MSRRTLLAIRVTGAWRTCDAYVTRSPRRLPPCSRRRHLVFRALSLRVSSVTAYMSRALHTAVERGFDDEGVWGADKDSTKELDMYTQLFEGEGEGWTDPVEAGGRQLSQALFFNTHTAPSPSQPAFTQHTPQWWRR